MVFPPVHPGVQLQPPALSARRTIVSRPVPTVRCACCNLFEVERWLLVGGVGIAVAQPGALSSIQRRASRDRRREGAEPGCFWRQAVEQASGRRAAANGRARRPGGGCNLLGQIRVEHRRLPLNEPAREPRRVRAAIQTALCKLKFYEKANTGS